MTKNTDWISATTWRKKTLPSGCDLTPYALRTRPLQTQMRRNLLRAKKNQTRASSLRENSLCVMHVCCPHTFGHVVYLCSQDTALTSLPTCLSLEEIRCMIHTFVLMFSTYLTYLSYWSRMLRRDRASRLALSRRGSTRNTCYGRYTLFGLLAE